MQKLVDKLLLLGLCLLVLSLTDVRWIYIVVMLAAVAVGALNSYFENKLSVILSLLYILICIFFPVFVVFLPLLVYDLSGMERWMLRLSWVAALPTSIIADGWQITAVVVLCSATAFLLQHRTSGNLLMQQKLYALTDDAKEKTVLLEGRNRELLERQDYEVRLATLAERNRIAREIHDNVGHLLTRAILQLSAMAASERSDNKFADVSIEKADDLPADMPCELLDNKPVDIPSDNKQDELYLLKNTLTDAMDSIRSSVHNLHDESINLKLQLESIINAFTFCPVKFRYDASELPVELRVCFAAVVRESLSNIARHSNATQASVAITEHPAFCQLVIWNNGSVKMSKNPRGIGLQNMADRVSVLGGVFSVEDSNGFRVFVSVPTTIIHN